MPGPGGGGAGQPAAAIASPGRLVTRSDIAAGPISSAVDSTAPMTTAASATATASAAR